MRIWRHCGPFCGSSWAPTIISVITAHTRLDLVYVRRLCHAVSNLVPRRSSVKHSENLFPLFQKFLLKLKHLIYFHNLNPLQLATRLRSRRDQHLPLNLCAPRRCITPKVALATTSDSMDSRRPLHLEFTDHVPLCWLHITSANLF